LADEEGLADDTERGLYRFEIGARARYHHRQRAFFGAADPAADRAIELHDVFRLQQIVNFHRHVRADGGEIDEAFYSFALDHAALAGRDLERSLQRRQ